MGFAQKSLAFIEPDEYLLLEAHANEKHEYLDGAIYAWQGSAIKGMAGASMDHNRVVLNVCISLRAQAKASGCEVFSSDVRLRPDERSAYFYPDVMVRCGPRLPGTDMEVSDAAVVVEVLSDTTETFDRQDKFERYQRMSSLRTYVLISPARASIEVFTAAQGWKANGAAHANPPDGRFDLGFRGWSLLADEVFDGIQLEGQA